MLRGLILPRTLWVVGGIGVIGQEGASAELANTPVIACKHARAHSAPPGPRLQHAHVNTHSDKQANTRSGSTFRATERGARICAKNTTESGC